MEKIINVKNVIIKFLKLLDILKGRLSSKYMHFRHLLNNSVLQKNLDYSSDILTLLDNYIWKISKERFRYLPNL